MTREVVLAFYNMTALIHVQYLSLRQSYACEMRYLEVAPF